MRKEIKNIGKEKSHTFTAVFERTGWKSGYKCDLQTVLLTSISMNGKIVADHLWFNLTKGFKDADMKPGDIVEFQARVASYTKGYKGYKEDVYVPIEKDYKLERPTRIKVLRRCDQIKIEEGS